MNNKLFIAWVLVILTITHVSCRKDRESIGLNTGDNTLDVIEIDTFTVITRTVKEDSVQTQNLSYNLLGAINDVVFGKSTAHLYTHFLLPSSNFTFGASPQLDSVVLTIKLLNNASFNGNASSALKLKVFELNESIYKDSIYYSDKMFTYNPVEIGNYNSTINLSDSVEIIEAGIGIKYAPHIRIRLDKTSLGQKLLDATPVNLASNDAFLAYLKGVYIESDGNGQIPGQGLIPYVDLKNAISGIAVYYNGNQKAVFPVTTSGARVNRFEHDYLGSAAILNQLNNPGSDFNETYLQTMAGLKTKIEIPGLLNLTTDNYAIIGAQITFSYDNSLTSEGFPAFSRTILTKPNDKGLNDFIIDQVLEPNAYGGSNNTTNHTYTFSISREIQDILTTYKTTGENKNKGFFLIAPADNPVSASHLRLDTKKNDPRGIKFKLSLVKTF